MEDRERDEEIAVVEEYLAEEALNAQDTLLNQIKEEDKLKSEVFDDVIAEDEKKSKRKARKTAKKKFDSLEVHSSNESEAPTASESDLVPNEVQDSIFNLQRSIDEINDKPIKGLASSLLLEIAKGYIDTNNNIENKSDVIELELGRELHKNGVLVGYEVINNETGEVKRLSLKNIDSLCKNAKYNIKNKDLLS
jgi:hypothetical protein